MSTVSPALFSRHLDLSPLRGRHRGLVTCIFHSNDSRGSLSVDLDRGLFNCFACGARGGTRRFAELVGEQVETRPTPRRCSPFDQARGRVLAEGRRQHERAELYRPLAEAADFIRVRFQLADRARRVATALGPSERVWNLLAHVARVQTEALAVEAAVDQILAEGRLA